MISTIVHQSQRCTDFFLKDIFDDEPTFGAPHIKSWEHTTYTRFFTDAEVAYYTNENTRLIFSMAKKKFNLNIQETDELYVLGLEALYKAICRFDPRKAKLDETVSESNGAKRDNTYRRGKMYGKMPRGMSTYVCTAITNEFAMRFRSDNDLRQRYGISLNDPCIANNDGDEKTFEECICDERQNVELEYARKDTQQILASAMNQLTQKEKDIVIMFYGFSGRAKTETEIAVLLEMSQANVSKVLRGALAKLSYYLAEKGYTYENLRND